MTEEDRFDLRILNLGNAERKLAIEVHINNGHYQLALCRAIDNEWVRLIDVTADMAAAPGRIMRVFRLTDAGIKRRDELRLMGAAPANERAV